MSSARSVGCGTSERRQVPNSHQSSTPSPWDDIHLLELTVVCIMTKSTRVSRPRGSEPALRWGLHLVSGISLPSGRGLQTMGQPRTPSYVLMAHFCSFSIALQLPCIARFLCSSLFFLSSRFFFCSSLLTLYLNRSLK